MRVEEGWEVRAEESRWSRAEEAAVLNTGAHLQASQAGNKAAELQRRICGPISVTFIKKSCIG